jgi:hypothetical protein
VNTQNNLGSEFTVIMLCKKTGAKVGKLGLDFLIVRPNKNSLLRNDTQNQIKKDEMRNA